VISKRLTGAKAQVNAKPVDGKALLAIVLTSRKHKHITQEQERG